MANTVPVSLRYDRRMLEVQLPEHNLAGILEGKFPEPGLTEEEQLQLLASDGMLVKRPIIVTDDGKVLIGFKESDWANLLK